MRFDWDTFMLACQHPNAKPLFAQPRRCFPQPSSTISRVDGPFNQRRQLAPHECAAKGVLLGSPKPV